MKILIRCRQESDKQESYSQLECCCERNFKQVNYYLIMYIYLTWEFRKLTTTLICRSVRQMCDLGNALTDLSLFLEIQILNMLKLTSYKRKFGFLSLHLHQLCLVSTSVFKDMYPSTREVRRERGRQFSNINLLFPLTY